MSDVTVVVPSWNRRDLLERLLEHLGRQTHRIEDVLVVDNGSTDGSAELAASRGARVIEMGSNAGFCAAVNQGIRETRTPWVAVVNNDVEPAPEWLASLLAAAQQPGVWFATGKLLSASKRDFVDGAYDTVCRGGCSWRAGHGRPDGPEWDEPRAVRFVPFTAALFRTELFQAVGLLDERFESYLEDVDFGLRCAMKGHGGVYVPGALASHIGSATLGAWHPEMVRRIARNQVLLIAKHYPRRRMIRYGWPIAVAQALWGLLALRHGAGWAFLRGKVEALRQLRTFGPPEWVGSAESERLGTILEKSELELFELQRRTGFDFYWRLYFALT